MTYLDPFLTGVGNLVKHLGFSGCIFLLIGGLLLLLVTQLTTRTLGLIITTIAIYRRLPLMAKQAVWVAGTYFIGYKILWPILPKTTTFVALLAAFVGGGSYGAWRLSDRYGLGSVWPWEAWIHHFEAVKQQRGLTRAVENTTGKKNGRARTATQTATGFTVTLEPPDGLSPTDFADGINNGEMAPAVAREEGWGTVKRMTATVMKDHTVLVHVDRLDAEAGELLADVEEWTP